MTTKHAQALVLETGKEHRRMRKICRYTFFFVIMMLFACCLYTLSASETESGDMSFNVRLFRALCPYGDFEAEFMQ